MKIKIVLILFASLCVIACSQDELPSTDTTDQVIKVENTNPIPNNGNNNGNNQNRSSGCSNWVPPTTGMSTPGQLYYVTYSDNPADYPWQQIDIECARKDFFDRFCKLRMTILQNEDPFKDTWILMDAVPFGCTPGEKDDVDTAANEDPRVCVGTDCD